MLTRYRRLGLFDKHAVQKLSVPSTAGQSRTYMSQTIPLGCTLRVDMNLIIKPVSAKTRNAEMVAIDVLQWSSSGGYLRTLRIFEHVMMTICISSCNPAHCRRPLQPSHRFGIVSCILHGALLPFIMCVGVLHWRTDRKGVISDIGVNLFK